MASLTFNDFDLAHNVVRIYKTESKFYDRDGDGKKVGTMKYRVVEDTKTVYSVQEIPLVPEVKLILQKIKDHHKECISLFGLPCALRFPLVPSVDSGGQAP